MKIEQLCTDCKVIDLLKFDEEHKRLTEINEKLSYLETLDDKIIFECYCDSIAHPSYMEIDKLDETNTKTYFQMKIRSIELKMDPNMANKSISIIQ